MGLTLGRKIHKSLQETVGFLRIDDELVEKCRRAINARCETIDVSKYRRRQAEEALAAEAKLAIVDVFQDAYPERHYMVSRTWPDAHVTLHNDIALIDPWLGHDYTDKGDGIEPVRVSVFRSKAKNNLGGFLKRVFDRQQPEVVLEAKVDDVKQPPVAAKRGRDRLNN